MTRSYPVIGTPKCHQMLKNHHLQISNPLSSGKKFPTMPFWFKSRRLIGFYEMRPLTVKVSGGGDGDGSEDDGSAGGL